MREVCRPARERTGTICFSRAPRRRDDDVPRDGDAVLVGEGRQQRARRFYSPPRGKTLMSGGTAEGATRPFTLAGEGEYGDIGGLALVRLAVAGRARSATCSAATARRRRDLTPSPRGGSRWPSSSATSPI